MYLEVEIDLNAIHLLGIGPKFKQTGSNIEKLAIGDAKSMHSAPYGVL